MQAPKAGMACGEYSRWSLFFFWAASQVSRIDLLSGGRPMKASKRKLDVRAGAVMWATLCQIACG
jgi:hypothetical protein